MTDVYSGGVSPSLGETVQSIRTGSRDSGCYGSSEQIIRKVTETQPVKVPKSSYIENKENFKPSHGLHCIKSPSKSDDMSSSIYSSDSTRVNSELDRSDKEYTEEDKEVGEITKYFAPGKTKLLSTPGETNSTEEQMVMYLCSGTQTSPFGAISCDTKISQNSSLVLNNDIVDQKNRGAIENASSDSSVDSSPHKKPKPFLKKIGAKLGERCDAQVQVMSPMSSQIYSSYKSVVNDSKIQSDSKCVERKSKSPPALLNGYMQSNVSTSESRKSGPQENWTKVGMKQSVYGPVQKNYRSIRKSLVPLVTSKLAQEKIDLKQEPYSNKVITF